MYTPGIWKTIERVQNALRVETAVQLETGELGRGKHAAEIGVFKKVYIFLAFTLCRMLLATILYVCSLDRHLPNNVNQISTLIQYTF